MNEHTKAMQKQYRLDHKEDLAEKKRAYYQHNKEKIRTYQHKYRSDHQEECNRTNLDYYHKNSEAINARLRSTRKPVTLHRELLKEFRSKYSPWNEGHVRGVFQIDNEDCIKEVDAKRSESHC